MVEIVKTKSAMHPACWVVVVQICLAISIALFPLLRRASCRRAIRKTSAFDPVSQRRRTLALDS